MAPISTTEDFASLPSSGAATPTIRPLKNSGLDTSFVVDPSQPKPTCTTGLPPASALERLSPESRSCVENFAAHTPAPPKDVGLARTAAVLVALYQPEGEDSLRIILTTRASHLRRNPGQTALPGGKVDEDDPNPIYTARREAFEEVGLPLEHPDVYLLTVLEPLLTVLPLNAHMRNHIVVTPVVAFISDPKLVSTLRPNPDEVDCIFDHPLRAIHSGVVEGETAKHLAPAQTDWWPLADEFHSLEDRVGSTGAYRMHRFRTRHTPIRGFSSNVLILVAALAYGGEPEYGHYAPEQRTWDETIDYVVKELPAALAEPPGGRRPLEWGTSQGFVPSGQRIE